MLLAGYYALANMELVNHDSRPLADRFLPGQTCKQSTSWTNDRAHEIIVHLSIKAEYMTLSDIVAQSSGYRTHKVQSSFEPPISLWQHLRLIR